MGFQKIRIRFNSFFFLSFPHIIRSRVVCWPYLPLKVCVDVRITFPPLLQWMWRTDNLMNYIGAIQNRLLFLRASILKVLSNALIRRWVFSNSINIGIAFKGTHGPRICNRECGRTREFRGCIHNHPPFRQEDTQNLWMHILFLKLGGKSSAIARSSHTVWECTRFSINGSWRRSIKFTHILPFLFYSGKLFVCVAITFTTVAHTYLTLPYLGLHRGLGLGELPRARNPHVWVGR